MEVSSLSSEPGPEPARIESRPKAMNWWGVVFFMVLGVGLCCVPLFDPTARRSFWGFVSFAVICCWLPAFLIGWWTVRGYIVADENGVRWRSMGRAKSALWSQVSEFYQASHDGKTFEFVHTTNGKFRLNRDMTNYSALRAAIPQRALWATARQWAPRGATLMPGERKTFVLNEALAQWFPWLVGASVLVGLSAGLPAFTSGTSRVQTRDLAWWLALGGYTLMMTFILFAVAMVQLPIVQSIRARRGESISLTTEEICWQRSDESIRARWNEVLAFRALPLPGWIQLGGRYEVETRRGSFSFDVQSFKDGRILARLIQQLLPPECTIQLNTKSEGAADIAPDGSLWFSYRNPTARAMLILLLFFALVLPIRALLRLTGWVPLPSGSQADVWLDAILGGLGLILVAYTLPSYLFSGVRTSEQGLEHRTPWRTRRVDWAQMRAIRKHSSGYSLVFETSEGRFVSGILLSDLGNLIAQITRYAPNVEIDDLDSYNRR